MTSGGSKQGRELMLGFIQPRVDVVGDPRRPTRTVHSVWLPCRSFRVCGPTIWNKLPLYLRSTDTGNSLNV